MSVELNIRPAVVEDAADVLEIERSCAEAPHWSEGVWSQILAQTVADNPLLVGQGDFVGAQDVVGGQQGIYGLQRYCLVAEHEHEVVGFIVLHLVCGCGEIESLAVFEFARRHGVGRSLCEQGALWAQNRGAASMQLEVRAASVAALALYGSLGFVEQGRRKGYYSDPTDDAVLMGLALVSGVEESRSSVAGRPTV